MASKTTVALSDGQYVDNLKRVAQIIGKTAPCDRTSYFPSIGREAICIPIIPRVNAWDLLNHVVTGPGLSGSYWRLPTNRNIGVLHDDVIKWKHFPHYWPFVRGFTGEFPSQRPVMRNFDVFFDLHLRKRLSKQSRRRWLETPSRSLWRHNNVENIWERNHLVFILLIPLFNYRSRLTYHIETRYV